MKQDDLRGKIMNEVKSQIRGIVNEEVAKINTKQRLKDKIKPLVAEELKRMVNEDRDYAKLQELIWVDGSSGRGDEEMMDTLNQMYDNRDYDGMIKYLSQWDNGVFEPRKLKREKVKEVLLSFRRNLQENARSECIESGHTTFNYV